MRLCLRPACLAAAACIFATTLGGCRSAAPPASRAGHGEYRIRTDGIYECRGVEVPVSNAGWPFPPETARWAYFLKFYPDSDGETRFIEAREPITTAEAVRRIDHVGAGSADGKTYLREDHRVHIVFPRPFPRYSDGVLGDGQLILQWNTGPGPENPSVFRFVRWP